MTQLSADTPLPVLFGWMFVAGVGIGPTLAVFTIIVQNAVSFAKLGVATSNLTFFRQIGGSVGLAIAGTVFAQSLKDQLPTQVGPVFGQIRAAAPPQFQSQFDQLSGAFAGGDPAGLDISKLTGVGQSFGRAITDAIAAQAGPGAAGVHQLFDPFVGALDHAFFESFSRAIGSTLLIAVVATVLALLASFLMAELPLRSAAGPETAAATAPTDPDRATLRRAPAPD